MSDGIQVYNGQFEPTSGDEKDFNDKTLEDIIEGALEEDRADTIASLVGNEFSTYEAGRLQAEQCRVRAHYNTLGEYDPAIDLSQSTIKPFVKITGPKVQAAMALEIPILLPPGKPCWSIDPSPYPRNPAIELAMKQKGASQEMVEHEVAKAARVAANKLQMKMWDSLVQAGFASKVYSMVRNCAQYGTGIFHGPFMNKTEDNGIEVQMESLSWWSVYRDPWAKSVEDCTSVHVRKVIPKSELIKLKSDKRFDKKKIDHVLQTRPNGTWSPKYWETQLAMVNNKKAPVTMNDRYEVITRWGYLSGRQIRNCGFDVDDKHLDEQVMAFAVIVGNTTISCGVSELHSDRLPFYFVPHFAVPDNMDGVGIPEAMFDSQDAVNACERGKQNNLAFATKPMLAIQTDRVDSSRMKDLTITPGKVWPVISSEVNRGDPVKQLQFNMHVGEIDGVQQRCQSFAQEETGIPNFLQGLGGEGVHNRTLGGAQLQFDNAVTSIKTVIFNYENFFIIPFIKKVAEIYQKFDDDATIKGDTRVIATGVQGIIAKENLASDMLQFMQIAGTNPEWAKQIDPQVIFNGIANGRGMFLQNVVLPPDVVKQREVETQALQDASMESGAMAQAQAQAKIKAETSPKDALIASMNKAPEGTPVQLSLMRDVLMAEGVLSPATSAAIDKQMQLLGMGQYVQAANHGAEFAKTTEIPQGQVQQPITPQMPHPNAPIIGGDE
jgi:hypothetical protein